MSNTSTSNDKTVGDDAKVKLIIGEIGRDTKTGIIGRGYSFDNGRTFHVTDTIYGRLYDDRDIDGVWNNGMHEKVKEKVNQEIANTVEPAIKQADSAVAYANDAIEKSRVNQQAIEDINSAVSDAVSDAAVARSDGLRAWDAAQSNVDLIDLNYASASAAISSARTEAIAAADEAKASASAAQADIVAVRSDVAAVQAGVTANKSDVVAIRADVASNKSDAAVVRAGMASDVATVRADVASNKSDISAMRANVASDIAAVRADANALTSQLDGITSNGGGRNLAVGTSSNWTTAPDFDRWNAYTIATYSNAKAGDVFTVSVDTQSTKPLAYQIWQGTSPDKYAKSEYMGGGDHQYIASGTTHSHTTFTWPSGATQYLIVQLVDNVPDGSHDSYKYKNVMLEKGTVAHDWQPAPEDTGADIAAAKSDIAVVKTNLASQAASLSSYAAQASAAGQDITILKSQAGQFEQEMADTKGDVSQLKVSASSASAALSDAAGNISILQANAKSYSAALSDTNSNVATVTATASKLETKYADAAGDISQIKTDAKGTAETIADAQGDIASLKKRADGFDTQLSNANGDISKLQTDASGTKQTLTNAKSDIAVLQSRADGFDAEFVSANGNINKLQTDAKGTTQTLADAQDDIAKLKVRADGFDTQFSSTNGDINKLQTDAKGTTQTLTNAKSDIAVLQSRADGYDTKFADTAGDISTLQASAKSYSAALSDAKGDIATVKATASELETKYADAAGDINQLQTDAKGTTQTLANAQDDIAKLKVRADGFDTQFSSTNGDINKLQTDAKGTTQTLTNAKSDIAVLQSRADGFDAKYADVAGDINTIKVNAKGMQQTLTNAKGDISTLQATATGFKNTLTDAQGNISTLQSDVSGLKKTTSDHAGNIATLQADAKTLTSQMSGAQGDISTLKQTASGFSSKVSGMETSLANANNKLDGITSNGGGRNLAVGTSTDWVTVPDVNQWNIATIATYSNAKAGDVFTISVDTQSTMPMAYQIWQGDSPGVRSGFVTSDNRIASGTTHSHTTFTWPSGATQYLIVQLALNAPDGSHASYKYKNAMLEKGIVAHDWSPAPEDTDAKITANSTAIDQNRKSIALKADQTTVDKTNGDVQRLQAQLKVQADQIATKVSSSDLDAKLNDLQIGGQNLLKDTDKMTNTNYWGLRGAQSIRAMYGNKRANEAGVALSDYNVQGNSSNPYIDYVPQVSFEQGTDYTISFWMVPVAAPMLYLNANDNANHQHNNSQQNISLQASGRTYNGWKQVTATFKPTVATAYLTFFVSTAWVSSFKLEKGNKATDWSSAPADAQTYTQTQIKQTADSWNANLTSVKDGLTKSYTNLHATVDGIQAQVYNSDGSSRITQLSNLIATKVSSSDFDKLSKNVELQTLDSADINSMRTSGHYFVHNLANTPIQGWVYVDVVGNGNDRIRQDVYQDSGIEHKYRRWFATHWTDWEEGATESEITQLSDDINIRVKKGNVVSQINQEAGGNTLIQVANGQGKLALNASSVVFSGSAFIPDAYISTLNADKLRFYDSSGNVATMSAGLEQYDDDKSNKTIVLQYAGGYEVHASDLLGSILTMHDNTIRLAVKANGMASSGSDDQYSGFYAMSHYAQLSCYRSNGSAPGIYITDDGYTIKGDSTGSRTKWGDLNITSPQIYVTGGNSVSLSGSNAVQMQVNKTHACLSDSMLHLYKDGDNSSTATQLRVEGWAWINGWVEAAGHSQHSALSTKTDIQSVDDEKMLKMVNDTDLTTFLYKTDIANGETHRHIGLIIDDVHDVAQYQTPQEFIAPNGVSRDDDNMIGALFGAVKALTKRIKTLESKVD